MNIHEPLFAMGHPGDMGLRKYETQIWIQPLGSSPRSPRPREEGYVQAWNRLENLRNSHWNDLRAFWPRKRGMAPQPKCDAKAVSIARGAICPPYGQGAIRWLQFMCKKAIIESGVPPGASISIAPDTRGELSPKSTGETSVSLHLSIS
jgi:hypothetical protein